MICYRLPENFMEFSILYKSFFNTSFSISCTALKLRTPTPIIYHHFEYMPVQKQSFFVPF